MTLLYQRKEEFVMDNKDILAKLKALTSSIEDYLDRLDMDEADEEQKSEKKPVKKPSKED